jgi:hypothetical protein
MEKSMDQVSLSHFKPMTRFMYVIIPMCDVSRLNIVYRIQKEPIEALLRSIFLVLMDNATAEYSFVTTFFATESSTVPPSSEESSNPLSSPTANVTAGFDERHVVVRSEIGGHTQRARADSIANPIMTTPRQNTFVKTERIPLDAIWKQIMDPVLEYCQVRDAASPETSYKLLYNVFIDVRVDFRAVYS